MKSRFPVSEERPLAQPTLVPGRRRSPGGEGQSMAESSAAALPYGAEPPSEFRMGITLDLAEDLIRQADRLGLRLDPATVKALLTESLDAKLALQAASAESEDPAAYEAWFRQAVADGIADADAGRLADVDVVRDRVLGGR
jgi:hypothetical protein